MTEKAAVRKTAREAIARMTPAARAAASRAIAKRVLDMAECRAADVVFCYASMPGEVETGDLIESLIARGARVCLPRVRGREMEAAYLDAPDDLAPGAFGIPEPQGEAADPASIDLTLVPGAAFDKSGGRLGRGGGYYDRYLPLVRGLTVGLAFECQMLETVPREAHDIGIQRVVTESAVYGEEDAT